ncbi:hypothetical protein LMG32289_05776 [Cupriavidus pampae]|uniref:Lipoprotein n=2 Tax=Cupriavidus pampae TaxID=659251 RepID=A0ABN7ZKT6_9BURK|nr:hypothetical protein LMG32289_05776 [Cupriavidus pampae]
MMSDDIATPEDKMKPTYLPLAALLATMVFVTGCSDRKSGAEAQNAQIPVARAPLADDWLGKWNGPEGTFLEVAGGKGRYEVTVQNLDGPRTFEGRAVDSRIAFERDGVTEMIRATNGAETGMKWLAEKQNCLTVRSGEGYCRD